MGNSKYDPARALYASPSGRKDARRGTLAIASKCAADRDSREKSPSLVVATAAAISATAATTTATTAPSAAVTAASAGARGPFTRFVDRNGTAIDFGAIEGLNRPLAGIIGFHFHEPKTARAARFAVRNHFGRANASMRAEQRLQRGRRRRPGEITDVNLLRHHKSPLHSKGRIRLNQKYLTRRPSPRSSAAPVYSRQGDS